MHFALLPFSFFCVSYMLFVLILVNTNVILYLVFLYSSSLIISNICIVRNFLFIALLICPFCVQRPCYFVYYRIGISLFTHLLLLLPHVCIVFVVVLLSAVLKLLP